MATKGRKGTYASQSACAITSRCRDRSSAAASTPEASVHNWWGIGGDFGRIVCPWGPCLSRMFSPKKNGKKLTAIFTELLDADAAKIPRAHTAHPSGPRAPCLRSHSRRHSRCRASACPAASRSSVSRSAAAASARRPRCAAASAACAAAAAALTAPWPRRWG